MDTALEYIMSIVDHGHIQQIKHILVYITIHKFPLFSKLEMINPTMNR